MINLFCHKNNNNLWASNYELRNLWPTRSRGWHTDHFIEVLNLIDPSNEFFSISEYDTNSENGYYVIFYPQDNAMYDQYGLMFLDADLIAKVNQGKLKLLIILAHETFDSRYTLEQVLDKLYCTLSYINIHQPNSVVFFSCTQKKNLHQVDNRVSYIYYPWFEVAFRASFITAKIYSLPEINFSIKDKTFISLIAQCRQHRILLMLFLHYKNLIPHGYISWFDTVNNTWDKVKDIGYDCFKIKFDGNPEFLSFINQFGAVPKMTLDEDPFTEHINSWVGGGEFYSKSYIEVINETKGRTHTDNIFLTEKAFKSIYHGLPFIINGGQYHLEGLRDLGYETFPELFDESYDTDIPTSSKIEKIGNEIKKCCDDPEFPQKVQAVKEKLIHNQNLFWNKPHHTLIHDLLYNAYARQT